LVRSMAVETVLVEPVEPVLRSNLSNRSWVPFLRCGEPGEPVPTFKWSQATEKLAPPSRTARKNLKSLSCVDGEHLAKRQACRPKERLDDRGAAGDRRANISAQ